MVEQSLGTCLEHRKTDGQKERNGDMQTHRQTDRQTDWQKERRVSRQGGRSGQTNRPGRQPYIEAEIQTTLDRQTDRHSRTNGQAERESNRQMGGAGVAESLVVMAASVRAPLWPQALRGARTPVNLSAARGHVCLSVCVYVPHCLVFHGPGDRTKLMSQLESRCTTLMC